MRDLRDARPIRVAHPLDDDDGPISLGCGKMQTQELIKLGPFKPATYGVA